MSTRAILKIDGQKFRVLKARYAFTRKTDDTGYVSGNVRFDYMEFTLESDKSSFFLQWMFEPALQKSGTLSFYEEDGIKKIKQVIFGGAFCIDFREDFKSFSSEQMVTRVRISAGGVRVEDSTFKFPWFKKPLVGDVETIFENAVEILETPQKPTAAILEKPKPVLKEVTPVAEPPKNVITKENIVVTKMHETPDKVAYYTLSDKITGAEFASISVPFDPESGPELDLYPHEASLPNNEKLFMNRGKVPITQLALEKAIELYEIQNTFPPKELPARIVASNLKNWQKEFVKALAENNEIFPEEAGKIAAEKISYGIHRKKLLYTEISVVKMANLREVEINGVKYKNVPTNVYLTAKKPK